MGPVLQEVGRWIGEPDALAIDDGTRAPFTLHHLDVGPVEDHRLEGEAWE
jgi:hypothetical protein